MFTSCASVAACRPEHNPCMKSQYAGEGRDEGDGVCVVLTGVKMGGRGLGKAGKEVWIQRERCGGERWQGCTHFHNQKH